jgi:hypothetical protein
MIITQGIGDFPAEAGDEWSTVPEQAIKATHVGDYPAEYVQGHWELNTDTFVSTWSPDGFSQTLRWKEGQHWFEIAQTDAYWLKPGMAQLVALAESMTYGTAAYQRQINPDDITSIKDAETLAGFDLLEPGLVPEGFHMTDLRYDASTKELHAVYLFPTDYVFNSDTVGLFVAETRLDAVSYDRLPEAHLLNATAVSLLGDGVGAYIVSQPEQPWTVAVERSDVLQLIWKQDGLLMEMSDYPTLEYGGRLTEDDMLAIAKSFK